MLWVWGQLNSCALEVLPLHFCESVVSSVAGKHNFQVQKVMGLIHPCSTWREKEIHVDSKSVVCIAPVQVYVAGL